MADNTLVLLATFVLVFLLAFVSLSVMDVNDMATQQRNDFGIGQMVTTTTSYEIMANDSFTGVVVRGNYMWDDYLTIRNTDGIERDIAVELLEPMR